MRAPEALLLLIVVAYFVACGGRSTQPGEVFRDSYGIKWNLSPSTVGVIDRRIADSWGDELVTFWHQTGALPASIAEIVKFMRGAEVYMLDAPYFELNGRRYAGGTFLRNGNVLISTESTPGELDAVKVESLYRHELSHWIVDRMLHISDSTAAHDIFNQHGLDTSARTECHLQEDING